MSNNQRTLCLEFFFDYLSPSSYLSFLQLQQFVKSHENVKVVYKPVLFAGLLDHWKLLGSLEIKPKRLWMLQDCIRFAKTHNFPFGIPKQHPFNPLLALRASMEIIAGVAQEKVIETLFYGIWGAGVGGIDPGNEDEVSCLLKSNGLNADELLEFARKPFAEDLLRKETEEAIQKGVFGVPSFIIQDQLFWGKDQFTYIEQLVNGADLLNSEQDRSMLEQWNNPTRVIDRPMYRQLQAKL